MEEQFEGVVEILEADRAALPGYVSDNARECLGFEGADAFPSVRLAYRPVELRRHEPLTREHVDTSNGISEGVICALLGSHLDVLLKSGLNVFAVRGRNGAMHVVGMFRFNGTWHLYLFPHEMEWDIPVRVFERA